MKPKGHFYYLFFYWLNSKLLQRLTNKFLFGIRFHKPTAWDDSHWVFVLRWNDFHSGRTTFIHNNNDNYLFFSQMLNVSFYNFIIHGRFWPKIDTNDDSALFFVNVNIFIVFQSFIEIVEKLWVVSFYRTWLKLVWSDRIMKALPWNL